ncbi:MAG: Ig-like domain-containing protein [Chloroflexota bacterium]|nr:Ig-like domain-containing protein [Chloroflexota bacterium]
MRAVRNLKVWAALLMVALAASVLMAVVIAAPAQAAPFSVTNTADSGEGSLRQAISDANASAGEDTINFDPSLSGQTITLGSQLPAITDGAGLVIDGGSANITVSGNSAVRVFAVGTPTISGAKLTLNNLTVANGRSILGGGILNESSNTLTVSNSTLSGNNANEGFASGGGGIWNNGGMLTVSNSTLSGNSANYAGGGIHNNSPGTLTVSNSTLSGNSVTDVDYGKGGGISSNGGSVTLKNTIVANSPSGGSCYGTITNGGYNLDSDGSCGFGTTNYSLSGTTATPLDPQLGSLANNGGPTLTHALLAGSPAIDKGSSFSATIDQRGLPRPSNFVGIVNADDGSDIGAFESQAPPDTTAPKVTNTTVPAAGAMQVGPGVNVTATFTEAMDARTTDGDPSTINGTTVKLFRAGTTTAIGAVVSYNATTNKATLNPNSNLRLGTKYKAVVTTGAQDLAGNRLDQNSSLGGLQQKTWTFTTRG